MTKNDDELTNQSEISLRDQVFRFKWRIALTYVLVIIESVLEVLFPLFIGLAINGLLEGSFSGVIRLGILGLVQLAIGSGRRFYDARVYSRISRQISQELVEREQKSAIPTSKIIAHTSLLEEFIEFLEWSMPKVVGATITLIGILVIIADLNVSVLLGCIGLLVLIIIVYASTGKLNLKLNAGYNSQLENQLKALESKDRGIIRNYFKTLMKWNIKLSDLDTVNFIVVWLGAIVLLVYTTIVVADPDIVLYGSVFTIVIYVILYMDTVITLPDHIQQVIRLNEISGRVSK